MKVALIYSGGMRSFDKCWQNHRWFVWRHFPGAKVYCVTEQDEDAHKAQMLKAHFTAGAEVRYVKQPEMVMPAGCPASWTPGQPYMHEPYHISVPPSAVMGQLWMLREGWRLYEEGGEQADLVIRIRPDLWFHSFEKPHGIPTGEKIPIVLESGAWIEPPETGSFAWTPRWGRFGGSNDRFALLGPKAAQAYFTAYDNIPDMIKEGAPLHPETLVDYAMTRNGVTVNRNMKADFSTLRKTGEMRPPEVGWSDVLDAGQQR